MMDPHVASLSPSADALAGILDIVRDPDKFQAQLDAFNAAKQASEQAAAEAKTALEALAERVKVLDQRELDLNAQAGGLNNERAALASEKQAFHNSSSQREQEFVAKQAEIDAARAALDDVAKRNSETMTTLTREIEGKADAVGAREAKAAERDTALVLREATVAGRIEDFRRKLNDIGVEASRLRDTLDN